MIKLLDIRICITICCLSTIISCSNQKLYKDAYCIQNVHIIDPLRGSIPDQTIIIRDDAIEQIFASGEITLHPNNTIIDGTGKYIIPGLWDSHVHFAYMEHLADRMLDLFFCYGITSIRDIGGRIEFVKQWKDLAMTDPTRYPRVKIAGPLLDGMPNVYDGSRPQNPPLSVGLKDVAAVDQMIDSLIAQGVDLLKAYEMLTPAQFKQIIERAKAQNLKVTGHVPLSMDVISASNAGMNSMEHLRNLELSCASNAEELLAQRLTMLEAGRDDTGAALRTRLHAAQRQTAIDNYDENVADNVLTKLSENDTWQIPTLALNTAYVKMPFVDDDFQTSFKYLPDSTEIAWKEGIEAFSQRTLTDFNITYSDWMNDMVKNIHDHDIPIMAGTDCPIFFLTPGLSLHLEMETLVNAGLEPLEVLKTATYNPALYFNMEDQLGSINEGMIADLLILNANPLDDISNTTKIESIFKNGVYHSRATIDERLEALDRM